MDYSNTAKPSKVLSNAIGLGESPASETRPPNVSTQLRVLQNSIALLEETADMLRERLQPVLRQEPEPALCADLGSEPTTPISVELQHLSRRVSAVSADFRDQLNRCEL